MKIVWLIRGLLVLLTGSFLLASDSTPLTSTDKHMSSDQAPIPLPELECSFCACPCFNKRKVAVLPCAHLEHARCYQKWLEKGGACPTCREPVSAVRTCRRLEDVVPLLQECTFAMQRKLHDTKAQLAEETRQRGQEQEQTHQVRVELERTQAALRESTVQVAVLTQQVNRLQSERTYCQGTVLMTSGLVILMFGMKKIIDTHATTHSAARQA